MIDPAAPAGLRSRDDSVALVRSLSEDSADRLAGWQNPSTSPRLDALAAWTEVVNGWFSGRGGAVPASWTWVAHVPSTSCVHA